jgi:hypothetical protein
MQIRELSCKTLQIPMKTTKPQKREKNQKKREKITKKNCNPIPIEGYYFLVSSTRAWSQQHGLLLKFDQEESEVDEAGMVRVMKDVMAVKLKR